MYSVRHYFLIYIVRWTKQKFPNNNEQICLLMLGCGEDGSDTTRVFFKDSHSSDIILYATCCVCRVRVSCVFTCRAGHLRYFLIFSIIRKDFLAFFIKLITYFCTSPI